jgi:hypothetical protein
MNGQRQECFIPEIPELAVIVSESHATKSSAGYNDGVAAGHWFCVFDRSIFHTPDRQHDGRQPPDRFLAFSHQN